MTIKELLDFCEKREVEIYTYYDFIIDSIVIKMRRRRGNKEIEATIPRQYTVSRAFGLTGRVVLREMADKLDKKEAANDH